ncbi:MAG: hypothetical protein M1831_004178 [Alyxoria varia]|nr:MAG: hypothetical protein M1831_004178 [Alyxoria varia]
MRTGQLDAIVPISRRSAGDESLGPAYDKRVKRDSDSASQAISLIRRQGSSTRTTSSGSEDGEVADGSTEDGEISDGATEDSEIAGGATEDNVSRNGTGATEDNVLRNGTTKDDLPTNNTVADNAVAGDANVGGEEGGDEEQIDPGPLAWSEQWAQPRNMTNWPPITEKILQQFRDYAFDFLEEMPPEPSREDLDTRRNNVTQAGEFTMAIVWDEQRPENVSIREFMWNETSQRQPLDAPVVNSFTNFGAQKGPEMQMEFRGTLKDLLTDRFRPGPAFNSSTLGGAYGISGYFQIPRRVHTQFAYMIKWNEGENSTSTQSGGLSAGGQTGENGTLSTGTQSNGNSVDGQTGLNQTALNQTALNQTGLDETGLDETGLNQTALNGGSLSSGTQSDGLSTNGQAGGGGGVPLGTQSDGLSTNGQTEGNKGLSSGTRSEGLSANSQTGGNGGSSSGTQSEGLSANGQTGQSETLGTPTE